MTIVAGPDIERFDEIKVGDIMRNMYAYAEARIGDDSVGPQGEEGFDVVAIGVHYGFSFKGFHRR